MIGVPLGRNTGLLFDATTVADLDLSEDLHSVTHSSDANEREHEKHTARAVAVCSYGTLEWMFTINKATLNDESIRLGKRPDG
jgi:hypothetical protein